ncbi:MAG: type II toxin-antitoxin system Phd/YefM family antitoxin [Lysobacterales bacterium]
MQINMLDAKNRLSALVKAAQAGVDVVIAKRGQPVARLIPVGKQVETRAQLIEGGIVAWLEAHPLPNRLRRSKAAIAAAMDQERGAWD